MDIWKAPLRLFPGLFILNSGVGKLRIESNEHATRIHDMAQRAYPMLSPIEPVGLVKALGAGETVLGVALLSPFVPTAAAGAALTGFAGALLWMYWKSPTDAVSTAAFAMAIGASGAMSAFRTTPLLSMSEATEAMKKAGSVGYQAPK